ncbi:MAG: M48 family metallopeptidase [Phycisphaeraceae bacterium]|nr:M48 family metallopeptidase [Phycisphaeraceae bacterium]
MSETGQTPRSPTPPPARRSALDRAAAGATATDRAVREGIKAYPGTTTYIDLIRKNKRDSAALILLMLLLGAAVGAAMAASIALYATGDGASLLPSVAVGGAAALIFGAFGVLWSWFGGANAILRMSGAIPIGPQDDPELYNVVDEMRIAAGIPMPKVYIINDSALNAFATGRDPQHGVVAITRGLRAKLPREELQAVIAHEIAHIRHLDIRFAMLMATMVGLIVFACDAFLRVAFRGGVHGGRRSSGGKGGGAAVIVLLVIALVLAIVAPLFARIIQMAYSRQREYLADAGAVELTRNPEALANALRRLGDDEEPLVDTANRGTAHMYIVNPLRKVRKAHGEVETLFCSHPAISKRIARLLALVR